MDSYHWIKINREEIKGKEEEEEKKEEKKKKKKKM